MLIIALLAQIDTSTALSGASGWTGAGLLGLVLAWLLFVHLPAKDKLLKEYISAKDTQLDFLIKTQWEKLEKLSSDFKQDLQVVTTHCQKELDQTLANFTQNIREWLARHFKE